MRELNTQAFYVYELVLLYLVSNVLIIYMLSGKKKNGGWGLYIQSVQCRN